LQVHRKILQRLQEGNDMNNYTVSFQEIDRTKFSVAGGKGA